MLIARACMQFGRRQLDGNRKRLWRGRETCRRFSRICRADLNESGTEHQSRTLMSRIVQVSGNGLDFSPYRIESCTAIGALDA